MLDLFIAADLARRQTRRAFGTDVSTRRAREPEQPRLGSVRSGSARALRALAAFLEPSRHETVVG